MDRTLLCLVAALAGCAGPPSVASDSRVVFGGLASDGTAVFWNDGTLMYRYLPGGGAPTRVSGGGGSSQVAIAGDWIYSTAYGAPLRQDGQVIAVKRDGSGPAPPLAEKLDVPCGIATDDDFVYFGQCGVSTAPAVRKVPRGGGDVTVVATGAADGDLVVDGGFVYWTSVLAGSIQRAPTSGGPAQVLATKQTPVAIGVHGGALYWTNLGPFTATGDGNTDGNVMRAALDGSAPTVFAAVPGRAHRGLAFDDRYVYFTATDETGGRCTSTNTSTRMPCDGTLQRIALDGSGGPALLEEVDGAGSQITLLGDSVYWTADLWDVDNWSKGSKLLVVTPR